MIGRRSFLTLMGLVPVVAIAKPEVKPETQVFSNSGAWTKPTGCARIIYTVYGGGGAGSGL